MHLQEITDVQGSQKGNIELEKGEIILDGAHITEAELQAKRESGAHIAETGPNVFKTLQKLNG